ncbi:hypothetical protein Slin15195_G073320 [Septoria linicola]|uniref:Uncharacterized protein n=1 Tax=Septoria linicola TaxID=215465 RepID=A0A9Q9AXR3_9PEZI|nr:hypothetical protein Slin15195_G073320 [Septoria linicola]
MAWKDKLRLAQQEVAVARAEAKQFRRHQDDINGLVATVVATNSSHAHSVVDRQKVLLVGETTTIPLLEEILSSFESLKDDAHTTASKVQTANLAGRITGLCAKVITSLQTLTSTATLPAPFDGFATWEQKYMTLTAKHNVVQAELEKTRFLYEASEAKIGELGRRMRSACLDNDADDRLDAGLRDRETASDELETIFAEWSTKQMELRVVRSDVERLHTMASKRQDLVDETQQKLIGLIEERDSLQKSQGSLAREEGQVIERCATQRAANAELRSSVKEMKRSLEILQSKQVVDHSVWTSFVAEVNSMPTPSIAPPQEDIASLSGQISAMLKSAVRDNIDREIRDEQAAVLRSRISALTLQSDSTVQHTSASRGIIDQLSKTHIAEFQKTYNTKLDIIESNEETTALTARIAELSKVVTPTGNVNKHALIAYHLESSTKFFLAKLDTTEANEYNRVLINRISHLRTQAVSTAIIDGALAASHLAECARLSRVKLDAVRDMQHNQAIVHRIQELQVETASCQSDHTTSDDSVLHQACIAMAEAKLNSIQRTTHAAEVDTKIKEMQKAKIEYEKLSIRDHTQLDTACYDVAVAEVDSIFRTKHAEVVAAKAIELNGDATAFEKLAVRDHLSFETACEKSATAELDSIRREKHAEIVAAKVVELNNDAATFDMTHHIDETQLHEACKKVAEAGVGKVRREIHAGVVGQKIASIQHELSMPDITFDQTMVLRQTSEKAANAAAGRMVREKEVKVFARKIQDLEARMLNDSNVAANNATLSGELSRKAQANAREEAGQLVESEKNAALEAKLAELRSLPPVISVDVDVVRQQLTAAQRELCETVMIAKEVEILQTAKEDLEQKTIASSAPQSSAQARAALDTSLEMRQMIESTTAELNTEKRGHAECSARLANASSQLREVRLQMDKEAPIRELLRHVRSSMHELNTIEDHDKLLEQASASKARAEQLVARGSTAPNDIELLGAISDIDESLKSF